MSVEVDGDAVGIIQEHVKLSSNASLHISQPIFNREQAEFGSFMSEDQLFCIDGPDEPTELVHSLMRATPINSLYSSHWYSPGVSCESRGYGVQLQAQDDCWPFASRWVRRGSPEGRSRSGVPAGGQWASVLDSYDKDHGYPVGTAREWVTCSVCSEGSIMRTSGFGQNYDCEDFPASVVRNMRTTQRSSFISNSEAICLEGNADYLRRILADTSTTPLGSLFSESQVVDQDCEARGYGVARDMVDECWPDAAKHMRVETQDEDMGTYVQGFRDALESYDSSAASHGMWNNHDWVACRACEAGGAVRDRGLWITMHGGDALPYSDAYCRATIFPDISSA